MYSTRLASRNKITRIQAGSFVSLFCFFILTSCGEKDKVVASVGENKLTEKEAIILMEHFGEDVKNDSVYKAFLEDWTKQQVYMEELKAIDPENYSLVRLRSDYFGAELAKLYLEEQHLKQLLDTVVSDQELQEFYDVHKEEFILHDYIVKALYLKIPSTVDFKKKKINYKFLLKNDKDLKDVNSYAKLYAENYYHNDSTWIYFTELSKDIPLSKYNIDNIVMNRTKTYFTEGDHTYFLNIIDYKLKDEAPPIDFLADQIKEIIISQRLQDLKEKKGNELFNTIKKKHETHINP